MGLAAQQARALLTNRRQTGMETALRSSRNPMLNPERDAPASHAAGAHVPGAQGQGLLLAGASAALRRAPALHPRTAAQGQPSARPAPRRAAWSAGRGRGRGSELVLGAGGGVCRRGAGAVAGAAQGAQLCLCRLNLNLCVPFGDASLWVLVRRLGSVGSATHIAMAAATRRAKVHAQREGPHCARGRLRPHLHSGPPGGRACCCRAVWAESCSHQQRSCVGKLSGRRGAALTARDISPPTGTLWHAVMRGFRRVAAARRASLPRSSVMRECGSRFGRDGGGAAIPMPGRFGVRWCRRVGAPGVRK